MYPGPARSGRPRAHHLLRRRGSSGAPIGVSCGRHLEDLARPHDDGIGVEVEPRRGDAERVRARAGAGSSARSPASRRSSRSSRAAVRRAGCRRCRPATATGRRSDCRAPRRRRAARRRRRGRSRVGRRRGAPARLGAPVGRSGGVAAVGVAERRRVAWRAGRRVGGRADAGREAVGLVVVEGAARRRRAPPAPPRASPRTSPLPRMASERSATRRGAVASLDAASARRLTSGESSGVVGWLTMSGGTPAARARHASARHGRRRRRWPPRPRRAPRPARRSAGPGSRPPAPRSSGTGRPDPSSASA